MNIVYSYLNETGQLVTSPAEITRGVAKGVADLRVTPAEGRAFRVSNARKADVPTAKCFSPAKSVEKEAADSTHVSGEAPNTTGGAPALPDAAAFPSNSTN